MLIAAQYTETVFDGNTVLAIPRWLSPRQYMPVGYLAALKSLRQRKGWTQGELAERLGVEQPTVQRWEAGKREPSLAQLLELANILEVEPGALIDSSVVPSVGPRLYIKGGVAAGVWRQAFESPQSEWQSFVGRPDIVANPDHRFGLRVIGDSMDVIYPEGTILECVSVFGHIEPRPDRRVIVLRTSDAGEVEATVKELVEKDGELWLVPRSNNPAHTPFRINDPGEGIKEVRVAAVVVGSYKPE